MRGRKGWLALLVIVAVLGWVTGALAYSYSGNHWASNSAAYYIDAIVMIDGQLDNVQSAIQTWNNSNSSFEFSGTNTNNLITHANLGSNGTTGTAYRWVSNNHYTQFKVELNKYYYDGCELNTWLHELGHVGGLDHSTVSTAIMYSQKTCSFSLDADDDVGMFLLYSGHTAH